jgi:hypothetical protein
MSPEQPKPISHDDEAPDFNDPEAMREYINDLSGRLKRDRHQLGPVKARMMEKRLKKLKRHYGSQ